MATAVTDTRYTPEDLLALPDAGRYELIDGQLVERNMGAKSSYVAARLLRLLGLATDTQALGLLFGSDCGYQIFADDPSRVRYADGSFIRRGRLSGDTPPEGHCRIPPDLAIEAVSPNDLARAIEEKVEQWLAAGVRLVWVLYPDTHRLHVHRYDGTVSKLRSDADDVLSGEDVVPGFQCRVAEIFQGL
jgi:Uma2 family endonuclease